jgi:putative MATE family efflux protein
MIKNMTSGSPARLILTFSLPILIGNLFQQLYNISDTIIVGRLIGIDALAAVGATGPIFFFFLMIAFGFTSGLTVITAQRFGAGDKEGIRNSVTHCFVASTALSAFISLFLILFLKPLLRLMNVPENIMADAYNFMLILGGGTVLLVFYNLLSGFIRALGDSKTPLYFLMLSTVLNIMFNLLLIYHFKLGVVGSALGTIIAVSIAVVLCLWYIYIKFPILRLKKHNLKISAKMMKEHLDVAVPMALQASVISVSIMIVQSVCNSFGANVIAAFTSALRIEQVATQPLLALGIAIATYSAQNWGAGKLTRIRQGVRIAGLASLIISILMSVAVRYVGSDMISIFMKEPDPEIINIGHKYLQISTLFYFFLGMIFVFRNSLQGMGNGKIPLLACVTELGMRSFASIYLASIIGYTGLFYAGPIAWLGAATVAMIGYVYTIRHIKTSYVKDYFKKNQYKLKASASVDGINQTPGE